LNWLTWEGAPSVALGEPADGGSIWRRAWVDAVDLWGHRWPEDYRLSQNRGTGLIIQGTSDWADYVVEARVTPWLAAASGIAARCEGMRRYYALLLASGGLCQLVRVHNETAVLQEVAFDWQPFQTYDLSLEVAGADLIASIDGVEVCRTRDDSPAALTAGGVALVCQEGTMTSDAVRVSPRYGSTANVRAAAQNLEEVRS
jgi:hypothetical protein